MVATIRCQAIANEKFASFRENEVYRFFVIFSNFLEWNIHLYIIYDVHFYNVYGLIIKQDYLNINLKFIFILFWTSQSWCVLKEKAQTNYVPGFGEKLSAILDPCLCG